MYALFENLSERFEVQRNRLNQVIEVFEIGVYYAGSCLFECFKKLKIVQTPSHHNQHHSKGKDTHYCVLTDFLNPY